MAFFGTISDLSRALSPLCKSETLMIIGIPGYVTKTLRK